MPVIKDGRGDGGAEKGEMGGEEERWRGGEEVGSGGR